MKRRHFSQCRFTAPLVLFTALAALAALATARSPRAAAEDWPEFRGPTGQGHSDAAKTPVTWSQEQGVQWRQELPGRGWSSPVTSGNRVYVTAAVPEGEGHSLRLLGCDLESGKIVVDADVFQQPADSPRIHSKNSHASPTPLIRDGKIYAHFGHQGTACLTLGGEVVWRNTELSYKPVHGNGGSPVLVDGLLIFSADGGSDPFLVALDSQTGKVQWRKERPTSATKKFSFSTPLVIDRGGRSVVISPGSDLVQALDASTGETIWQASYDGFSVIPRPVEGHGMVFFSSGYMAPSVLAVRTGGDGDVTRTHLAWTLKKGAPNTPSLLLLGDELYMVSDRGVATCVDAHNGEIHWQERLGGGFSASPVFAGGHIYMLNEEGDCFVLKPGPQFKQIAKNSLGERTLASIGVAGDTLLIRSESHLYRIRN